MISVIIPTYNTALLIERTIRSVIDQRAAPEWEMIVVDDGSTDNTLDMVECMREPRIRIFRQGRNLGPAAARNRGLREAQGEYCAFLDGDDYWNPDFLAETYAFLTSHQEAVAVSVGQYHKVFGAPPKFVPGDIGITDPVLLPDFYAFWAEHNHVCTGSVLMRTAVARQAGGQREDLRICEDLEFWALLATYGPWGFIPNVLFVSDGALVTKKQGWFAKNRRRWATAVPMEEWSRRPSTRIPDALQRSFSIACGRLARNMTYSLLLSGRVKLARQEVFRYGDRFPDHRMSRLIVKMANHSLTWYLFCKILFIREALKCIM